MKPKTYTVKMTTAEMFTAYFHLMEGANIYERYATDAEKAGAMESVDYWKEQGSKTRDLALKLQALSHPGHDDHRSEADT